jgi:hypothetical protein
VSSASAAFASSRPEQIEHWSVPRCFAGRTIAILCGGKSLRLEDIEKLKGRRIRIIAINRAFELAPKADWLYGCDAERFWTWHPEALAFKGTKITVMPAHKPPSSALLRLAAAGVHVLRHAGRDLSTEIRAGGGASPDPGEVRGNCSLAQVLSIIAHTGAAQVLLLGADMRPGRWHDGYPGQPEPDYARQVIPGFASLVRPLAEAGVDVVNVTPGSALPWWPRVSIEEVLG